MRNPILTVAIAIVFAASSQSALARKIAATGSHYKEGTITVRKAGKGQQEYLRGSTGPTVPPKPVGSTLAAPKLGGSTGPTAPPKPTQGNTHK